MVFKRKRIGSQFALGEARSWSTGEETSFIKFSTPRVCENCIYHKNTDKYGRNIWYNHVCLHPDHSEEDSFVSANDDDKLLSHCREFNSDGRCPKYKKASIDEIYEIHRTKINHSPSLVKHYSIREKIVQFFKRKKT